MIRRTFHDRRANGIRRVSQGATIPVVQGYLPHPFVRFFFYIFAAAIPFEVLDVGGSNYFSLSKLAGMLFAVAAILFAGRRVLLKPPKAFWYFAAYVLIMGLLGLAGGRAYLHETVRRSIQMIQMLILLAFGYQLLQNSDFAKRVFLVFSLSAFVLVSLEFAGANVLKVLQWGTVARVSILDWAMNSLGGVLATAGVAFLGIAFGVSHGSNLKKWLIVWLTLVPITLALARTGSRTGMLALIAGAMVLLLRTSKTLSGKVKTVAVGLVVVVMLMGVMAHNKTARVRWTATFERHDLAKRQDIFAASLDAFRARPIFGWGPGRNVVVIGAKVGRAYVDAHNSLLWVLTETGIVGAVPFLIGVLLCLRSVWRARNGPNGVLPLALFVSVLVINSANTAINMKYTWLVFAYALASDPVLTSGMKRVSFKGHRLLQTPGTGIPTSGATGSGRPL